MIARIEEGAETLLKHLGAHTGWEWDAKVLSETPGYRLVAHYQLRPGAGNSRSKLIERVGKFYDDQATGEHCYNAMQTLYASLATQDNPPLAIPEPIFYSADRKLLTLNWVGYRPYPELINTRNYRHFLRLAGKALAYLHRLPIQYGQVKTIADHLNELITPHPLCLAEVLPGLAGRIHSILEKLYQMERDEAFQVAPAPLHRDFHLRQLFCDNRKAWVIDWDMYSLGDPALDIGNFLVYLSTKIPNKSKDAGAAFLQGYQSFNPDVRGSNINLYQALTYLRLACKSYRLQQSDWEVRVNQLLTRCEGHLAIEGLSE